MFRQYSARPPLSLLSRRFYPSSHRTFTVLALESSADDSCAAIVTSTPRQILSNIVVKQNEIHEGFGGIHPFEAINGHQRNMPNTIRRAFAEAKMNVHDVDGIAFTRGPGIGGCLSVCSNAAKNLAAALNKPLVGVHHMQAHALTPFLTSPEQDLPTFPFLTLLVSGGHTLLLLAKSTTSFRILATTADESVGRVFDKVSRMLNLSWSGIGPGAALEQFCLTNLGSEMSSQHIEPFPRSVPGHMGFSYSGLHSQVERFIKSRNGIKNLDEPKKVALARAFQAAAVSQLEEKVSLALKWCLRNDYKVKHLVVSGGVASNMFLRDRLAKCLHKECSDPSISLVFPPVALCTDNAAMIAWASMDRFLKHDYDDYSIDLRPKWSIEDLES